MENFYSCFCSSGFGAGADVAADFCADFFFFGLGGRFLYLTT